MTRLNLDPAVRLIGIAAMILCSGSAHAAGLGTIQVQSGLGQSLRLAIPLIGADSADLQISCIKVRIQSLDGVSIASPVASISTSAQGQSSLLITTSQVIYEPAMSVSVNLACDSRVHRDFQILLDPVNNLTDALATAATGSRKGASNGNRTSIADIERPRQEPVAIVEGQRRSPVDPVNTSRAPRNLAPVVSANRGGVSRNVLKLTSQDLTATELLSLGQLRLSRRLSEPALSGKVPPREELVAAQRRYAMLLRGEDPVRQFEQESLTQQKQIATLKQQSEASKVRYAAEQVAFYELQKNSVSFDWVIGLTVLLLGSLGATGWLGWRMRTLRTEPPATAWDLSVFRTETAAASGIAEAAAETTHPGTTASSLFVIEKKVAKEPAAVRSVLQDKPVPASSQMTQTSPVVKETADTAVSSALAAHEALQFFPARVEHLKVEEIFDVMQEAEFWLSLNDPVRAIEILEPYGQLEEPESPMPWLFLLDLYRDADNQPRYDALRDRTTRIFNTRIPAWNDVPDIAASMSLEDFPHVIHRICELWATSHIVAYLETLMLDNRDGIRRGFDIEVYHEVMLLMAMAKEFNTVEPFAGVNQKRG